MIARRLPAYVVCVGIVASAIIGGGTPLLQLLRAEDEKIDLSHYYGFEPLEIFKLAPRSSNLLAGDLNQDGLTDLVLIDNSHSRLDLLQQRREKPEGKTASATAARPNSVNVIESDRRFEHRKIPVDKQVAAMTLGDFNGDGRTDIAYFGVPDRLIIRYQPAEGDWTELTSLRLPDVPAMPWNLAAGDLNKDGKDDLALLGKNATYLILQQSDGTMGPVERLMNTSDKLGLAQIADLDGDGRNDLCYLASDDQERALCARLQGPDGRLGPELRFELNQPRAIALHDLDGNPGHEILTLDAQTGRLKIFQLTQPEAKPGDLAGRLIQYGFGSQGSGRDRDLATGDSDGDGLIDVVVTDPESAQMLVFRQHANQGLDMGRAFPGLIGAEQIRMADLDGNGRADVVVLSTKEQTIGLSRFEGGRLTFPRPLPVENEPAAMELADLDGDGREEMLYISRDRAARSSKYTLHAMRRDDEGSWKPHPFGTEANVELELRGTPNRLVRLDADHDGRPEFLVFMGLDRAPMLLTISEAGVPVEVAAQGGIRLGDVSPGAMFLGRREQPVVLLAQENFARNLHLEKHGQWRVVDQYNAAESNARIAGAAALNLDGEPGDEIVLVDSGVKKLRVLRREENVYRPWKEIETGTFPFKSTHVADLNGDKQDDLLLFGSGKFAVLYTGRTDPTLKELASFETKLENVYFSDVVAGDLNGDGRSDIALIDTRSHYVEILDYHPEHGLRHALHFKVFEEKSFTHDEDFGSEPRESTIADVTGDGRLDLILLSHDRVLVYPQE